MSSAIPDSGSDPMCRQSMVVHINPLPAFDPSRDPGSLSQRWKQWKRALSLYLVGKGIEEDKCKQALYVASQCQQGSAGDLYFSGWGCRDIHRELGGPGWSFCPEDECSF